MHRLLTIRVSHYNEKARWAFDRLKVPYREHAYMPLLHIAPVALATWRHSDAAADRTSTRFSTPVLVTDDGARICDSSRIVQWANARYADERQDLYPSEACEDLERRFGSSLGVHTRRLAYHWALDDAESSRALARANVGAVQSAIFSSLFPALRLILKRGLSIDADRAEQSKRIVLQEVAFASEYLGSRPYLVSDRFTAADISLACMLAPALLVTREEGYGAVLPSAERAHPEAAAFARELRATPAGMHAIRMFRDERTG